MKSNGSSRPTSPVTRVVVAFELNDTGETFHVAARDGVATVLGDAPVSVESRRGKTARLTIMPRPS
jgi:hypothetical protein